MKEYLLLFRGGDARMAELSEAESAEHMQKWGSYMQKLGQSGNLTSGFPLQNSGKVMTANGANDNVIRSEQGEAVGGYLLIKANDYDHAVKLSAACPIFEHNGNIEIREIMPMEM